HDAPVQGSSVTSRVMWASPDRPKLDITLNAPRTAVAQLLPEGARDVRDPFFGLGRVHEGALYWMLDVSSGADQLGLSLQLPLQDDQQPTATIKDMALTVPVGRTHALLLPQFQWEPMHNMRNDRTGDSDKYLHSDNDGGPSVLATNSVNMVPVAPVPVISELVRAFTEDKAATAAHFTLPFGIVAQAFLEDERYLVRPTLELFAAPLDSLSGER